jgi:enoyl-CoA hydratase/carnithine racemase
MLCLTRLLSITAISGHAPAGGAVLSLTSDYRIATQGKFKIGLNETQVHITY